MICNGFDNHTNVRTDLMIIKKLIVKVNIVDIE